MYNKGERRDERIVNKCMYEGKTNLKNNHTVFTDGKKKKLGLYFNAVFYFDIYNPKTNKTIRKKGRTAILSYLFLQTVEELMQMKGR